MARFGVGAVSPWWNAGFVCNPFRAVSGDEWRAVALLPVAARECLRKEDAPGLQVLGDAGRGKSSLLHAIVREATLLQKQIIYEYVPRESESFVSEVAHGTWFCLDEAQRLNPRERDRLLRMAREKSVRLLLAAHENLAPLFAAAQMPLDTVNLAHLSDAHFAAVLTNRLRYFARPGVETATLAPDAVTYLSERFGGDLRGAERFLYEHFQTRDQSPVPIMMRGLMQESQPLP